MHISMATTDNCESDTLARLHGYCYSTYLLLTFGADSNGAAFMDEVFVESIMMWLSAFDNDRRMHNLRPRELSLARRDPGDEGDEHDGSDCS